MLNLYTTRLTGDVNQLVIRKIDEDLKYNYIIIKNIVLVERD